MDASSLPSDFLSFWCGRLRSQSYIRAICALVLRHALPMMESCLLAPKRPHSIDWLVFAIELHGFCQHRSDLSMPSRQLGSVNTT